MLSFVTGVSRDGDLAALGEFRAKVRAYTAFSERVSRRHGCTPAMYQLLLAVRTTGRDRTPDIGMLAHGLGMRHHSAAELVRKAEDAGLVRRDIDMDDARRSLIELTRRGESTLAALATEHARELRRLRSSMKEALDSLG